MIGDTVAELVRLLHVVRRQHHGRVMDVAHTSRTAACTSFFECGSSPVVGSSSNSRTGAVRNALAMADLLLHPARHVFHWRVDGALLDSEAVQDFDHLLRAYVGSTEYSRAPYIRFSIGESFLKNDASTDTRLINRFTLNSSFSMSSPKMLMEPESGVSNVDISRMSVLFPVPFGSQDSEDLASLDAERDVVDCHRALALFGSAAQAADEARPLSEDLGDFLHFKRACRRIHAHGGATEWYRLQKLPPVMWLLPWNGGRAYGQRWGKTKGRGRFGWRPRLTYGLQSFRQ
jgi:hypothetical protein